VELTITSVLALFVLLAVSAVTFYAARRLRVPYTVLLVAVGLFLVPFEHLPGAGQYLGFLDDVSLTPELLFLVFLPVLIFESGYSMNIRALVDHAWTVSMLAVVALLISALGIGVVLWLVLGVIGLDVPFVVVLLFGAIISATDPVAVLALFKDFGAPRGLTVIFEGESLFNDGTAVALFFVVLGIATSGFHGASTVLWAVVGFAVMVLLGILLGLAGAGVFTVALRHTRSDQFVAATLLIISAHLVFITGELLNQAGWRLGPVDIRVSSIIACTISSLFLGNYARHSLTPRTDDYVNSAVTHLAFVANSLVFLLAGLLFASTDVPLSELWLAMVLAVLVVASLRAVSIYAVTGAINRLGIESRIPASWQGLLAWGSLRGALAIIVVLLVPGDFTVAGWPFTSTPRDFLLALTISCILVTLFVKAPLIGPLMRRLRVTDPPPLAVARRNYLAMYYLLAEASGLHDSETRSILSPDRAESLVDQLDRQIGEVLDDRAALVAAHGERLLEDALRLMAIDIEQTTVRQLYLNDEIGELTYRRLIGKLRLQAEYIESGGIDKLDEHRSGDRKDVFDTLVTWLPSRRRRGRGTTTTDLAESARSQLIMARRVVRVLTSIQSTFAQPVFPQAALTTVLELYRRFDVVCTGELGDIAHSDRAGVDDALTRLAALSRNGWGMRAVSGLGANGLASEADERWVLERFGARVAG
jgi:CPA1 family monovalent cation:H+ antiporter